MQFSKFLILCSIIFCSAVYSAELKDVIESRELGSCTTNNLAFSAMRFYKVPLDQKYQDYDLYLRVILFFNQDQTLSLRTTVQALLGCQTSSSGEQVCSFSPLSDKWAALTYSINDKVTVDNIGTIELINQNDLNRGFVLTFSEDFVYPHLRQKSFAGGMITVNFNQHGINTATLCKN